MLASIRGCRSIISGASASRFNIKPVKFQPSCSVTVRSALPRRPIGFMAYTSE